MEENEEKKVKEVIELVEENISTNEKIYEKRNCSGDLSLRALSHLRMRSERGEKSCLRNHGGGERTGERRHRFCRA